MTAVETRTDSRETPRVSAKSLKSTEAARKTPLHDREKYTY